MLKMKLLLICCVLLAVKGYSQCVTVSRSNAQVQSGTYGSTTSDYKEPYRAFDTGAGYDTSHWSTDGAGGSQWIATSFPESFSVCQITMVWGADQFPTSYSIKATNDYEHWKILKTVTYNSSNSFTLDIPDSGNYSVYQIDLALASGTNGYSLYNCIFRKRVANTPPVVILTSPASGTSIQGTNIQISATAQDNDSLGYVKKVQFYQDSLLLGTDSVAPYSYTGWTPTTIRRYNIYAKATDNIGAVTISDTAVIDIASAPTSLKNWILTGNNINNSNSGIVFVGGVPTMPRTDTTIKLSVNGSIYAKRLKVTASGWADYVFKPGYPLRPLNEVADYIRKYQHLPGVASAEEVNKNGVDLGDNQVVLLKKVEELTLYIIQLKKAQDEQLRTIEEQKKMLLQLKQSNQRAKYQKTKK